MYRECTGGAACMYINKLMLTGIPGGGGGNSYMKGARMLVVSLRGVNFRFWSHLGCSGQNTIIFGREGLF